MQRVTFLTLGCKVNQYETQAMREQFTAAGFIETSRGECADIYVINTCTVTASADQKSRHLIYSNHRQNPEAKIIVTGCYTVLDSDELAKIPGVTQIIKNQAKANILELLNRQNELNPVRSKAPEATAQPTAGTSNGVNEPTSITQKGISYFKRHTRAFLKIQDGCNNSCAYCKVPLVRGVSKSRPLNELVGEANRLVKNGYKEIVLCGICLGLYGKDLPEHLELVNVIQELENIEGLLRIRLSSIEAGDISDALIKWMGQSKKLCPHLHIPIQSGDDEILKKMNRNYSSEDYLNLIRKTKEQIPDIAITTDVMVGFPTEEEENFQNTVKLIKEVLPLRTHIFPYSQRKGTLAAKNFNGKLNYKKIKERINYLNKVTQECSLDYKRQFLNTNRQALIENNLNGNKDYWQGYTDNYIKVLVRAELELKNQLVRVRLKKINNICLQADLL